MTCRCPQCREDAKRLWEEWQDVTLRRMTRQDTEATVEIRPTDSWFAAFRKGERG